MTLVLLLLSPAAHAFDPTPVTVLEGTPARFYGTNVAFAGDVDADGFDDMLIGRYGAVEFYYGGPGGPGATPDLEIMGSVHADPGQGMGGIGDVNGDGFADFAIAFNGWHLGPDELEVYYGSLFGVSAEPDVVLTSDADDRLGEALAHGDLNGDGYDDLVVGAPGAGRVDVYLGGSAGLSTVPSESDVSSAEGHGRDLAVGDADGDGDADILVSNEEESRGAELLLGDGSGTSFTGTQLLNDGAVGFFDHDGDGVDTPVTASDDEIRLHQGAYPFFSSSQLVVTDTFWARTQISEPGDVDGDGYDDLVVATQSNHTVLLGGSGGSPTVVSVGLGSFDVSEYASLGDANGDGRADLLTGFRLGYLGLSLDPMAAPIARRWDHQSDGMYHLGGDILDLGDIDGDGFEDVAFSCDQGEPSTCVHRGGPGGLSSSPSHTFPSLKERAAGDINGDGYGDLVLAQPGELHVHFGGAGGPGATPDQVLVLPGAPILEGLDLGQDVDGDGDPDLVIVAFTGGSQVVATALSGPAGLATPQVLRVHPGPFSSYGSGGFLGLADVDGDGYADLIAEKPDQTDLVWFQGSASGPGGAPIPMGLPGLDAPSVMVSGDFDGDGFADLALSTLAHLSAGQWAVLHGSPLGPDTGRFVPLTRRPLWAGDLDGDGLDDLVTGMPREGGGDGVAVIHYGTSSGLQTEGDEVFMGADAESLGSDATALDIDGDGVPELVVGAVEWNGNAGRVLVFAQ